MDDFGMRLRGKFDASHGKLLGDALQGASEWIENELVPNVEAEMEKAAERGKDKVFFKHTYMNGYRPEVFEVEQTPAYAFFKAKCEHLGLEHITMSHQRFGTRDPKEYPMLEIMVVIPSRYRDSEGSIRSENP